MAYDNWDTPERFDFRGHSIAWGAIGDGPPAVLIHGTPFSSFAWHRIAPWLAGERRIYFYDLLGYGASDKPDGDVSRGVQNEVLSGLFDHWELDRPDVVAHDYGGSTALRGHLLNGLEFRSLVLVDPVAITPQGSPLVIAAKNHQKALAGLPDYIQEAIVRAYIGAATSKPLGKREMARYLAPWAGEIGRSAFWRQIAQIDDRYTEEVEWSYGSIRCPVAIVWARKTTGCQSQMVGSWRRGFRGHHSLRCRERSIWCSKTHPRPSSQRRCDIGGRRAPGPRVSGL